MINNALKAQLVSLEYTHTDGGNSIALKNDGKKVFWEKDLE